MTPRDPLDDLLSALVREGEVPGTWLAVHAPDGDLGPAWRASASFGAVLVLAAAVADRRAVVRALCALARSVSRGDASDARAERAIAAAEAWCRGEATRSQVRAAGGAAFAASDPERDDPAIVACRCCDAVLARRGIAMNTFTLPTIASLTAQSVEEHRGLRPRRGQPMDPGAHVALAGLAELVRAHLPCPRLEALGAAYRRG